MPVPTLIAAVPSGTTPSQLRHWRSGGERALFRPSQSGQHSRRSLYSFGDIVALRLFVFLGVSAEHLPAMSAALEGTEPLDTDLLAGID